MGVLFAGASEIATLSNTFSVTIAGQTIPADPSTVTLRVTDPTGIVSTYTYADAEIDQSEVGKYFKEVVCSIAGEWSYTWIGTGAVPDVEHGSFTVFETNLGHLYATPQMIKSRVGIPLGDTSNDFELHGACYAASRTIEQYCGRFFWRTPSTEVRTFSPEGLWEIELGPFNDLVSVTSIIGDHNGDGVFETAWGTTDYELGPINTAAGPERRPYTHIKGIHRSFPITYFRFNQRTHRVQVTGTYGWPAVPAAITEATRILATELFKAKDAPFGIASFGEYGAIRVQANPMVSMLADSYRHSAGFAV